MPSPEPADVAIFLPGIVMPAAMRYEKLFSAIGPGVRLVALDLLLARPGAASAGYSIEREVEALDRARTGTGRERVHIYGHSGGGAIALAYVAAHPERVASLALDEPSTDFSAEDLGGADWAALQQIGALPLGERLPAFRQLQVMPGLPVPVPEHPPAWLVAAGPARIVAFNEAAPRHSLPTERYRAFRGPVYYSSGSLTNPRFDAVRERLSKLFGRFEAELYQGLHHLHCSHQAEPDRVAAALRALWARSVTG